MKISERLFGSPISGKVKAELEKRQHLKTTQKEVNGEMTSILESLGDKVDEYNLSARTPFVRMWTSVKLYRPRLDEETIQEFDITSTGVDARSQAIEFKRKTPGSLVKPQYNPKTKQLEKYIVYNPDIRERQDYAIQTYIVGDFNYQEAYGEVEFGKSKIDFINKELTDAEKTFARDLLPQELKDNPLMKPQAGITSVTSTTKEFLGLTKETTVNFTVNNFYDFDRIYNRYFLKPGAQIFVDFGFSDIKNLYEPEKLLDSADIQEFLYRTNEIPGYEDDEVTNKTTSNKKSIGQITENEGSLEIVQGTVVDYTAKILPDGSVECSVTLLSTNSALLSSEVNDSKLNQIKNTLQEGALFLGLVPTLDDTVSRYYNSNIDGDEYEETKTDLEAFLVTPDKNTPSGDVASFNKQLRNLAMVKLSSEDFTPKGNSIRTGVFTNGAQAEDIYISWGFFEDIIINESFGIGENLEEIDSGKRLNIKMDSSNSFTLFHQSLIKQQQDIAEDIENDKTPQYLYPEAWGNNLTDETSNYGNGSFSFQRGKYPSSFYSDENQAKEDKQKFRIPIREMFINTKLISTALDDAAIDKKGDVRDFITNVLTTLNEESDGLFEWEMVSDYIGSEIKIVDNVKLDTMNRIDRHGKDGDNINAENSYFKNLFTFNIMSPNSIVKEYNVEFKLPSSDIGNMYAIQGMGNENKVYPSGKKIDNAVALSALDDESLSIQYRPERGSFRGEQLAEDGNEPDNLSFYQNLKGLLKSDAYQIKATRTTGLSGNQEVFPTITRTSNENNSTPSVNSDTDPTEVGYGQSLITNNNKILTDLGYRIVFDMKEYNKKLEIQNEETTIVRRPNLLPFNLSITIQGIATIQPGDIFRVDYLPEIYLRNVVLQTMNVTHNINSDGWFTTLETAFRPLPDIKQTHYTTPELSRPFFDPKYISEVYFAPGRYPGNYANTHYFGNAIYLASFDYKKESKFIPPGVGKIRKTELTPGIQYASGQVVQDVLDEQERNKKYNERIKATVENGIGMHQLAPFITEVDVVDAKDLQFIDTIFKFKLTGDIDNAAYQSPLRDQLFGVYNPLYAVLREYNVTDEKIWVPPGTQGARQPGYYKTNFNITRSNEHEKRDDVLISETVEGVKYYGKRPVPIDFYIPAPIIMEKNKYYYLVVNTGIVYITDEEGIKKQNIKFWDRELGVTGKSGAQIFPHVESLSK